MPLTQDNREASITTDLGKDKLLLKSMSGEDVISEPFTYMVEMLSEEGDLKFEDLVGTKVTITLQPPAGSSAKERYFNGYVADIRKVIPAYGLDRYQALVVPWFWFLKKSTKCRIFRNKTVEDILTAVFKTATEKPKFEDFEMSLTNDYPKLEHCVQYQETDFAFACRLMEKFGIYYFFYHEKEKHTMVLGDSKSARTTCPGFSTLNYTRAQRTGADDEIFSWGQRKQVVSDAFEQKDYNFAEPKKKLPTSPANSKAGNEAQGDFAAESFEHYVYEGILLEDGVSDPDKKVEEFKKLAEIRLKALQAEQSEIYANSDCRGLLAGYTFTLAGHDDSTQNGKYFITSLSHQIELDDFVSGSMPVDKKYTCVFTAIPDDTEYHPPLLTPKSRIFGPQTAVVVGEKKDAKKGEIYTDKFGRIKIQFHWDRDTDRKAVDDESDQKDKVDEDTKNRSCWVRVSQSWAGNKWGTFFLPRIGQEVIVEFLEGDPDQPIVTGSLYNGDMVVPYKLPDHKTMSTIKSTTHEKDKGSQKGFNEIRFEDEKDEEQIFIHAERSKDVQVLGDDRETIVGGNLQLTIEGDKDSKKKSDDAVPGNRDVVIKKGNDQLTLGEGDLIQEIGGGQLIRIKKNQSSETQGNVNILVGGTIMISSLSESSTGAIHIKGEGSIMIESASGSIHLKAKEDITLDAKGAINLNSGDKILGEGKSGIGLTGGKSTIDMSSDVGIKGGSNVTIKGTQVDINGSSPQSPDSPKPGESALDAEIEGLEKNKVSIALKEKQKMEGGKAKDDAITLGEIK